MGDKIPEVYFKINDYLKENYTYYNTPEIRDLIYKMLNKELSYIESIRCDDKNNPPSVVNENKVIARVNYFKRYGEEIYFIDLIFGDLDVEFV